MGAMQTLLGSFVFLGALNTQTVVNGQVGVAGFRQRGYILGSIGTISTGTSPMFGGATISQLYYDENSDAIVLNLVGIFSNSGYTSLTFSGSSTVLMRASATFNASGGNTSWAWGLIGGLTTQPLGGNGSTRRVGFN